MNKEQKNAQSDKDRYRHFYWLELVDGRDDHTTDRIAYIDVYAHHAFNCMKDIPVLVRTRKEAREFKKTTYEYLDILKSVKSKNIPTTAKVVIVQVQHPCDEDLFARRVS